ncbi:MAG: transcriptional regulator AsnC [Bacteriovoracaceae bacterium]|jgi:Lrp/AsnC family transcriptional regulator, regulator for asnA, asnC and gidA|nr:transcriptional regulator AsnC [Bacteriovoracaceae bacterium]
MQNEKLDDLDKSILVDLMRNGRTPFLELARKFNVSSGTIHVRVDKMKEAGIITGTKVMIDHKKLGLDVTCYIGIILKTAKDYPLVLNNLKLFDEVIEVHYTTGNYGLFIKVMTKSIDELQNFLIKKLQAIKEISSTETIISLANPLSKDITP